MIRKTTGTTGKKRKGEARSVSLIISLSSLPVFSVSPVADSG
jgi:hypothetical protein